MRGDHHCFSNTVIGWSYRVCLGAEEHKQWCDYRRIHSRPQSSSLLRMTDSEKSSGELGQKVSDWSIYSALNLQCVQGTVKEMDETPKKLCNRKVKICRCCNSHLSNIYDSIDLFGKTAQRENVIEKLKEVGKIEVQESDQDFLTTKICRKCFRKVTGLAKAIDDFRNICSQSKEIQISDLDNARLKRGRKPSTPTQEPHGKRRPTIFLLSSPQGTLTPPP